MLKITTFTCRSSAISLQPYYHKFAHTDPILSNTSVVRNFTGFSRIDPHQCAVNKQSTNITKRQYGTSLNLTLV